MLFAVLKLIFLIFSSNFPEIDCYVIIACPEMSILENAKDFYRPVNFSSMKYCFIYCNFNFKGDYSVRA